MSFHTMCNKMTPDPPVSEKNCVQWMQNIVKVTSERERHINFFASLRPRFVPGTSWVCPLDKLGSHCVKRRNLGWCQGQPGQTVNVYVPFSCLSDSNSSKHDMEPKATMNVRLSSLCRQQPFALFAWHKPCMTRLI